MEPVSIDNLEITNVSQRQRNDWGKSIDISFTIKNQSYSLILTANVIGVFSPYGVYHKTDDSCLFCPEKRTAAYCKGLFNQIDTLFHKLIELPSIRLEWLYLNYVPKQ